MYRERSSQCTDGEPDMPKQFKALLIACLMLAATIFLSQNPAAAGWGAGPYPPNNTNYGGPLDVCAAWGQFYGGGCKGLSGPVYGGNPAYGDFVGYIWTAGYLPEEDASGVAMPYCDYPQIRTPDTASGCMPLPPPPAKQLGNPPCNSGCTSFAGNPINILTGNKYEVVTDYQSPGPDRLIFQRYYNSQSVTMGSLGLHWSGTFDRSLQFDTGSASNAYQVTVFRPDGAKNL